MKNRTLGNLITALLMAVILIGCTSGARKARYSQRGEHYFKAGEYDKAKIEYLNVLNIDGNDAVAYARLGAMWNQDGAPLRAASFLLKAIDLSPDDLGSHLNLARVYLAAGRLENARKEATLVLEKAPETGEALLILVDASTQPADLKPTEQQLEKFPRHDNVYYHLGSAGIAAKKGDIPGVEAALARAVSADPKLPSVHSGLATLDLIKKDIPAAGKEFEEAARLAPARSPEKVKFAQFQVQTGAREQAKAYLKSIAEQTPDFLPAWSLLARIANLEKRYDDALKLVENVISRDPLNVDARLVQAESWLNSGETKKAVNSLESLDRSFPDTPLIKYALARAYLQNSNSNQALTALDQAVKLNPRFGDAVLLRAELHLKNGDAQGAIEPLQNVLKSSPGLTVAEVLLAEAYRILGRLDDAAAVAQQQIARLPQNAASYVLLGAILKQQNKVDEARRAFEKARELAPSDPAAVSQLVDLDIQNRDYADGYRQVEQLLRNVPGSAVAYCLRGKLLAAEGKFEPAQAALLKAINLDPNLAVAYDLLLPIYIRANKFSEARDQMNAVLGKDPDNPHALLLCGLIYSAMNDPNRARDSYEKLLAKNPNVVIALNNLAYIYSEKLNNPNRAAELAQKAHSLQPGDASINDTLGWILYKQGDYGRAADLLGRAVEQNPDSPEMQYHLGMADYMMGRTDAARAALQTAAGTPAEFEGKTEARQRLQLLAQGDAQRLSSKELEALLRQQRSDPIALLRLAQAYQREGSAAKAVETYENALNASPKLLDAAVALARLYSGPPFNDSQKALDYAKRAHDLAPRDLHVAATLGRIAYDAGNFGWAYSLLKENARTAGDNPKLMHDLGWAAYSLGKVNEAEEAMQHVIALAPESPEGQDARRFLSIVTLDAAGASTAAQGEVTKVLAADPTYVPALMARAAIQLKGNDLGRAATTYESVLQRFPDFAPAQKGLAAIYAQQPEKLEDAYALATKAVRTLAGDPELSSILGTISYRRREYSRAVQLFQESDRKKPLDPSSLFCLGMSHRELGHTTEARQVLSRAVAAGLAPPQADEAKRAIDSLASGG